MSGPTNDRADSRFCPEAGTRAEPRLARANVVFAFQISLGHILMPGMATC